MSFRSLLFVPGARPDRFEKALSAGADAVCIDLEDAVPPDRKGEARAAVVSFLGEARKGPVTLGVRINALSTPEGFADVAALAALKPGFVMVPKANYAAEFHLLSLALPGRPLWAVLETARGLAAAHEIAGAIAPTGGGVLFGGADYSAEIGADLSDWDAMAYARGALAAACGGAGIALLDVPYLDVRDTEGLIASTRRVKAMGYVGRACIHPDQVAPVNGVFTPTAAEIDRARRVIAALDEAKGAAALLDGKLVELPVIRAARRILDRAKET